MHCTFQDPSVRQAMLHTVRMIADAVHPDRLQEAYTFHSRGELVTQMRVMLKAENPTIVTTTTRALVLQALASLVYPFMCACWPFCPEPNFNNHDSNCWFDLNQSFNSTLGRERRRNSFKLGTQILFYLFLWFSLCFLDSYIQQTGARPSAKRKSRTGRNRCLARILAAIEEPQLVV